MAKSTAELLDDSYRIGARFLLTHLETAQIYLDMARGADHEESRSRNQECALGVYGTVLRLLPRVILSREEQTLIEAKLAQLRKLVQEAGRSFEP
jgi:hypothetical protein